VVSRNSVEKLGLQLNELSLSRKFPKRLCERGEYLKMARFATTLVCLENPVNEGPRAFFWAAILGGRRSICFEAE